MKETRPQTPLEKALTLFAVFLFFLLVSSWLTWPLISRMGDGLSTSADPLLNFWTMAWSLNTLPRDPLSFFNANIFFPRTDTLAYSEHLLGVTFIATPAYWLTGNLVFAYNFAFLGSFILSGLGMYLLVAELTGNRWAGLFAGVVYMALPYRFLHLLHIQVLSAQWFPFVFLFLYRFLRDGRPRQAAALSVFVLLQVLSCNYYAMHLAVALMLFAGVLLVFAISTGTLLNTKKVVMLLASASVVILLVLPFVLPYEHNRKVGFYRRYEDVVQFSAEPLDYLRPSSFNKVFYVDYLPRQQRSEKALFPGLVVILLGGVGLISGSRRLGDEPDPDGRLSRLFWVFWLSLIGLGFVLSLGPVIEIQGQTYLLPYRALYRYVPGFRGMRVPARFAILAFLGLSALSGWGLYRLLSRLGRFRAYVGAVVVALALFEYQTSSLDRILHAAPRIPPVYRWLGEQQGDFGVLELPIHEDITKEAMRMYYSTAHWKRLANGFSGWWPNEYWVLVGRMRHFPTYRILQFLGSDVPVRYIVIHYGQFPERRRQSLRSDMDRYRDRMPIRARFGSDVVYELLPESVSTAK